MHSQLLRSACERIERVKLLLSARWRESLRRPHEEERSGHIVLPRADVLHLFSNVVTSIRNLHLAIAAP